LRTQEIPNLKEIFRDEAIGVCAVHVCDGKYVIHSELFGEPTKERLGQAQLVNTLIDETFKRKGVEKLHTWAITDEQYRYNMFLGYQPTGNEVVIEGFDTPVYEFEKVLI